MRVRISYSVEIGGVPSEVSDLFNSVFEKTRAISAQAETVEMLLDNEDTVSAFELMNKMRRTLTEMDIRLADLGLILEGYEKFKAKALQEQEVSNEIGKGGPIVDPASNINVSTGQQNSDGGEVQ